jgi:4'-phosphopantetheinyl transferase
MEFESMAKRFFSPNEVAELMSLPPEQRAIAFFNCWTRKEAYIKAQGLGLSLPLDSFDVSLIPGEAAHLYATRPNPKEAARWILLAPDINIGYAAAIAVEERPGMEFRFWDWNNSSSLINADK